MKHVPFIAAMILLAGVAFAAGDIPTKTMLLDKTVTGDDTKHGVTLMVYWPVGSVVPDHTHPGDEYAFVLEGTIEVTTKGQGTKVYKAGEAYFNAKDVVHSARAVGDVPAKTIATIVAEKGKPLSEPVKQK
ncbi:MAG: cupin domain-containing protein [Alphaproteobacteria bacterium]